MSDSYSSSSQWSVYEVKYSGNLSTFPQTPYISPTPDAFPIIAVNPVPANVFGTLDEQSDLYADVLLNTMKYAIEAGCNAFAFGGNIQQTQAMLNAVERLNSIQFPGVLINSPLLYKSPEECVHLISEFRNNDLVKGWFVMDRPNYWDWGNVVPDLNTEMIYNRLTLGYRTALKYELCQEPVIQNGIAAQMTMFNLAASQDLDNLGRCKSYDEYLAVINRLFEPPLWSFSHYPFSVADKVLISPTDIITYHGEFYTYLDKFKNISQLTGKPFWATCQIEAFKLTDTSSDSSVFRYPVPDSGILRFEAFSALAYGAQGLLFSSIGLEDVSISGSLKKEPLSAPLHYDLKKGLWANDGILDAIKTVCKDISNCSRVFLGSQCMEIRHFGQTYGQDSPIVGFPFACIDTMEWSGAGVLAAILKHDTRFFMVLVNHNPFSAQNISLTLNTFYKYPWSYLSPADKVNDSELLLVIEDITSVPSTPLRFTLPAGGMAIFEWS